eukprot:2603633-Rhodomonas_salina.2
MGLREREERRGRGGRKGWGRGMLGVSRDGGVWFVRNRGDAVAENANEGHSTGQPPCMVPGRVYLWCQAIYAVRRAPFMVSARSMYGVRCAKCGDSTCIQAGGSPTPKGCTAMASVLGYASESLLRSRP